MKSSPFSTKSAFTLSELVVVVGITGVLLALLLPAAFKVLPKADEIVCMSHLHELWVQFSPCATDPEGWPQLPKGVQPGTVEEAHFWLDYSSNAFGMPAKIWHCPTIDRAAASAKPTDQVPLIHYLPTLFDARPGTPNRWPTMPWFTEIGNVHGHGNLSVDAEGSVQPLRPIQP